MDDTYDLLIVGGGPGGYVAAIRAAQLGMQVALVEKEHLGGVCVNWGCIPTKALLRNAQVVNLLGEGKTFGFTVDGFQADYGAAVKRSRRVSSRLNKGVETLLRNNGVQVVNGSARLASAGQVDVTLDDGGEARLQPRHVIVASGARARAIPGVEVDGERVMTARHALELQELPRSVVVIGAGPIGLEFAHVWQSYGAQVTIVEMLPHLAPLEDDEISAEVERTFKRRRVRFLTATRVEGVEAGADGVRVRVRPEGGEEQMIEADRALIAIGVRPNSEDMGLEEAGVELERGWVKVDESMRTSATGVYAIGDVTGKLPLAHVASAQGILAVETIAGLSPRPLDYQAMPRCIYCQPQVASLGLTEAQAREQGYAVQVGKYPFLPNGKALALGENDGMVKLIADGASGRLLGAHMVGPEVTELLPELVLARSAELPVEAIVHAVHAHPTLSEALAEAAHGVFGKAIHI